ncbi:hypothetical protein HY68_16130 [Streptomyces sp. AcH 505]|uniref:ArsR/SmtB family transcription factor n=1 Tax=Streptomyces sp. AcH 505 TaxID=352211 RepID=UPI0005919C4A|nr:hypothetical protein HY68_16130 [Streptomyces sp. AcH 505]
MLRLHFTAEDLARVQVATELDPLWETVLGLQQLHCPGRGAPVFRTWRRRALDVVAQRQLTRSVRLLAALTPNRGYTPDFLTPAAAAAGFDCGLDAIRATRPGRLRRELRQLGGGVTARRTPPRPWLRDLAGGDHDRMADLAAAVRTVHHAVIAPDWTDAHTLAEGDRALRARALRDGGVHGLLSSFGPGMRWEPPVLHADYPLDRDLRLAGRGLRLVPSYFCWRTPVSLADPELPPVLVYPVGHDTSDSVTGTTPQALHAILGRTRARTLAALHDTATTGELARRLRVSPASASQHVHALAAANLVHSRRIGNHVLHSLTPLGAALLHGRIPAGKALT